MKKFLLTLAVVVALVMSVVVLAEENGAENLIQNDSSYVQGDVMAIADDNLDEETTTALRYAVDGTPLFADIDYTKDTFASSVSILAKAGIVGGFPDGTFRPQNGLTRAEFCKMVNMIFGYTESDSESFIDISREDIHCWFYDIAMVAKKAGYIKGYEDNSFRGDNQLTREETCTVLNRILGLYALPLAGMEITDAVSDWAVNDVNAVVTNFLMPLEEGNTFRATEIIKRSEVIVVLANLYTAHQEELEKEAAKNEQSSSGGSYSGSGSSGSSSSGSSSSGSGSSGSSSSGSGSSESDSSGSGSSGSDSSGSGSSGDDNTGEGTEEDKEMTPEEIQEANTEILSHLATAKSDIQNIVLNETEYSIVVLFMEGFDGVTADANAGILITPEYVNEAYADKINQAVEIYEGMDEWAQGTFRDKLVSGIDTQAMSFLLDYFPLEYFL